MADYRFKNSSPLKGGNYWQNYIGKTPLYNPASGIDLLGPSFSRSPRKSSILDFLDLKTIIKTRGQRGRAAVPVGKSGMLSGGYKKTPRGTDWNLKYSWAI
jgi:hypothetical protein